MPTATQPTPTRAPGASGPALPSLLDEPAPGPAASAPAPQGPGYSPSRAAGERVLAAVGRNRGPVIVACVLLLIGAGVGLFFALRPVPQPDFLDDDMDLVLNYALLTDDFNHLPLDERLKLISELIERLKNLSSGDSAMMAAFAATIEEKARKQLVTNMSHLAIDVWDKYAVKYDGVTPEDRGQYLDETFVEFTKMMESLAGEQSTKSDEQRLEEVRRQAERDRKNIETGKFTPPAQALGRMFEFMNFEVGGNASPQQRSRGQLMMRDMMRHFRGEDVNGESKPATPSSGAPAEGGPAGDGKGGGGGAKPDPQPPSPEPKPEPAPGPR
jgi:hypothetical protein